VSGEVRIAGKAEPGVRERVDGRELPAGCQLDEPSEDVPPPIAAGHTSAAADGQDQSPAGLLELLRELDAGLARPDDENRAWRQCCLVAIAVGVNLDDPLG
jgi:hypothetical protein